MENTIGLKELRLNMEKIGKKASHGEEFVVFSRSKPLFKIGPLDDDWEEVIDFTKLKKGGVSIDDILSRL